MGRLCGGAHEISGIPAPLWLVGCGWRVHGVGGWVLVWVVVGWVGGVDGVVGGVLVRGGWVGGVMVWWDWVGGWCVGVVGSGWVDGGGVGGVFVVGLVGGW